MFGLVAIIICFICWVERGRAQSWLDGYKKSQSQDPFLWTDSKGVSRLKSNNQIAIPVTLANGHTYIQNSKGDILFDATERLAKMEAAKHPVDYETDTLEGYPIRIYEKNGKRYTIIHYNDADLIVNLGTMRIERPTNDQLRFELDCKARGYHCYSEEGFRDMIRDFNLKNEFDRRSIIGECNIQGRKVSHGSYWCNTIYEHRKQTKYKTSDPYWRWIK